jgi:hypothetical protein
MAATTPMWDSARPARRKMRLRKGCRHDREAKKRKYQDLAASIALEKSALSSAGDRFQNKICVILLLVRRGANRPHTEATFSLFVSN